MKRFILNTIICAAIAFGFCVAMFVVIFLLAWLSEHSVIMLVTTIFLFLGAVMASIEDGPIKKKETNGRF